MSLINCNCKTNCTGLGIIVSLISGIVALVLTLTGIITISTLFAWIAFGIAVGLAIITFLVSAFSNDNEKRERRCVCRALTALQAGLLGTILTSLVLLAVGFVATSIIGAIVYGIFVFFFILIITSLICLTRCLASCGE